MYASYFGLSETAFNVTPDPRFLYVNECYQEAIAALRYGIEARKGFIALVGEAGTGKTTMLRRLMDALDPSCRSVLLLHPTVSFDEILEHILLELGIPVDGARKLTMLQRLHEFLIEHTLAGGNVALLIDESQDLQTHVLEELRLLSNLETGKEKILQIVLAGQTELDQKFADPALRQLRQRITLQIRLRQLRADEVGPYIEARLARVGGQLDRVFDPAAVATIAAVSSGIPRVINVVCDAAMLHAFASESPRVTAAIVEEAWSDYSRGYQAMEGVPLVPAQAVRAHDAPAAPVVDIVHPPPAPPPVIPPVPEAVLPPSPPEAVAAPPPLPTTEPPAAPPPPPTAAPPSAAAVGLASVPPVKAPTGSPSPPSPDAPPLSVPPRTEAPPPAASERDHPVPESPMRRIWQLAVSGAVVVAVVATLAGLARRPPAPAVIATTSTAAPAATVLPPAPDPPAAVAPNVPPPAAVAPTITQPSSPPVDLPPQAEPLTPSDARALVERFRAAYSARDVQALGVLLAPDIIHNNARGRDRVLGDYEAAFADIAGVEYRLPDVQVALRDQRTIVSSPFVITFRQRDGRREQLSGSAEWRVERRDGSPIIASLIYRFDS